MTHHTARIALAMLALGVAAARAEDRSVPAGVEVDLELVLAADISGSVGTRLGNAQRRGFAAAFREPALQRAISSGFTGRIAVTYFEWAGAGRQEIVVPWRVLSAPSDMNRFAEALERAPERAIGGETSISGAMMFATALFDDSGTRPLRRVVDISGNGRNSHGPDPAVAFRALRERGATVNGLVMQAPDPGPYGAMFTGYDGPIIDYYRSNVIGGPGAFAMAVDPADGLAPAIVRKLVLEIAWRHPEPLLAIGDDARERPDIDRLFGRRNG